MDEEQQLARDYSDSRIKSDLMQNISIFATEFIS